MGAATKIKTPKVVIGLNAVLAVIEEDRPKVLCVRGDDGKAVGLPYGPFDPLAHRTFEMGLRDWVKRQTNVPLGFVEQLYTFGDKGREAPTAALAGSDIEDRVVSIGYLALAPYAANPQAADAAWRDWYDFFPWEDWRNGEPVVLCQRIMPALFEWAECDGNTGSSARAARLRRAFGLDEAGWAEERALDRYELMYEAGLVIEAWRDARQSARELPERLKEPAPGEIGVAMASDHRRILATAIGRLRGKLKYRPVIFEMMGATFTLFELQRTVEAIVGFALHKQNFRRSIEQSGLVRRTSKMSQSAGGRPAALFEVDRAGLTTRAATGLAVPRLRQVPTGHY